MTSPLFHCPTCCWQSLGSNVVALGTDGHRETITVACPDCGWEATYPTTPEVHVAVLRTRIAELQVVDDAEQIAKEAAG